MIDWSWIGFAFTTIAAAVGYGELRQKVATQRDNVDLLRADIKRLDEKIEHLTDFLLREVRGEEGAIFGKNSIKERN